MIVMVSHASIGCRAAARPRDGRVVVCVGSRKYNAHYYTVGRSRNRTSIHCMTSVMFSQIPLDGLAMGGSSVTLLQRCEMTEFTERPGVQVEGSCLVTRQHQAPSQRLAFATCRSKEVFHPNRSGPTGSSKLLKLNQCS